MERWPRNYVHPEPYRLAGKWPFEIAVAQESTLAYRRVAWIFIEPDINTNCVAGLS